jgi:tRNA-dihydrouridine synthase A
MAYHNPWILAAVDPLFGNTEAPVMSRRDAVEAMFGYVENNLGAGLPLHRITRHMLGLYHGQAGGRLWRQVLSVEGCKSGAGLEVLRRALDVVEEQAARLASAA